MAAPQPSTTPRGPIHWVLDWDGTMTCQDTLDALVTISALSKPSFPTQQGWKSAVDGYLSDYTWTLEALAPHGSLLPATPDGEKQLLAALKAVEQRSLSRVSAARIFEGLTKETITKGAAKAVADGAVTLRPGLVDLRRAIATWQADSLSVLSVNWSRHFIASCLSAAGAQVDACAILANELDGIHQGATSMGTISQEIVSSGDKLRCLEKMRQESHGSIVYVGDSWTDIECLLAADVGICIRDEPMGSSQRRLAEALQRLGVECHRLANGKESRVVWSRDFVEILEWAKSRGS
ncbi:hypothetical protein ACEQ8H_000221 [Pleosporales sp. CAS-2024a]